MNSDWLRFAMRPHRRLSLFRSTERPFLRNPSLALPLLGGLLILLVGAPTAGGQDRLIPIQLPDGLTIQAELADTPVKRAQGLMFRERLPKDRGMLFTFGEARPWTFWMKNTKIPLDIIWMDAKKRIVHIEHNVPICTRTDDTCPLYEPIDGALYVLELGGGVAESYHLRRGLTLKFSVP
jgi:hypothetical protein